MSLTVTQCRRAEIEHLSAGQTCRIRRAIGSAAHPVAEIDAQARKHGVNRAVIVFILARAGQLRAVLETERRLGILAS